jgi:hypothetical protein
MGSQLGWIGGVGRGGDATGENSQYGLYLSKEISCQLSFDSYQLSFGKEVFGLRSLVLETGSVCSRVKVQNQRPKTFF